MNEHALALPAQRAISVVPAATAAADPARDIRIGLIIAAFFFIGLLGWAAFARLDAAAVAPGRLTVSGQRQTVQHRDGGVVSDIAVREGDKVRQGQILIRLAGAEVRARNARSPGRRSPCLRSARGSRPNRRGAQASSRRPNSLN